MLLLFSILVFSQMHFFHQHSHDMSLQIYLHTYFTNSVHIKQILSWIAVFFLILPAC